MNLPVPGRTADGHGLVVTQFVAILPVVTVWNPVGPLLRTRSHRCVFTFRYLNTLPGVTTTLVQRWLAKPSMPCRGVNVTFAPGVSDRVVRASSPFNEMKLRTPVVDVPQESRIVVRFTFVLRIAALPEVGLLGVPIMNLVGMARIVTLGHVPKRMPGWLATVAPALPIPTVARSVAAANSTAASMEIKRFMIIVPLCSPVIFLRVFPAAGLSCLIQADLPSNPRTGRQ
jgi:hypothetical protein